MNYRFKEGDKVKVKPENPNGNPRTPKYVRGKNGVIVSVHGVISNPYEHRNPYPPLYTVIFDIKVEGRPSDKLLVDIHEEWLERI
ncbi:MAG: SH3-like domain-containing protein [Candidatus Bathyarchaeia archaeon]